MIFCRRLSALGVAFCLLTAFAHAQTTPKITGETSTFDYDTKEMVVAGNARVAFGTLLLTADTARYNANTGNVAASGNFVITYGDRRLVADSGTFNIQTRKLQVTNLRLGEFPLYLSGDTAEGTLAADNTPEELVLTNATVFFRDNARYSPSFHAKKLTYARGRIVNAEGLSVGLIGGRFLSFSKFEQALDGDFFSYFTGRIGYKGNLGALAEIGLHLPVANGVKLGADLGLYSSRGAMIGPSGAYFRENSDGSIRGEFSSGYISDSGDRKTDILGNPVPRDRSYLSWEHRQRIGEFTTIDGEFNYWRDSEILRDFRPKSFDHDQQPDSFLETAYTRDNYSLSAFARFHPNKYHRVQERLPEIRYDLMPANLPLGFYHRVNASAAVLQSDAFGTDPELRTNRLDAYYGIARPIAPKSWFAFTPVAGTRVTHYTDATGGKNEYTRTLGEVGFDSQLIASRKFDYKNEIWEIDGLRHLVTPKLSYRYAPEADDGRAYIPPIDRRVFSTYLQPLSIGDSRNIDDLSALNTLRIQLDNVLQTRDTTYGSRNLAALNFAADYRFDHDTGQRPLSDVYTEFAVTPASWLRWEVFHRVDPHRPSQQELNTAIELVDQEWWSLRLATHFLRNNYEEYYLEYRQRLNEVYDVTGLWRYDARNSRFNEQSYGIWQRLGQTWAVKYEVSFFDGPRRESSFAFSVQIDFLKF
ncbi:LPS-assembly protein LptD [Oleiharenicola lentus]|uniref:LPS-assembly protein LptD n=1 Tax=Oleiharenicola lentus TaxID=2508720 RepID=UPI003F66ECC6